MSLKTLCGCASLLLIIQDVFGNAIYMTELNIVQEHNVGEMGIRCASLLRNVSYVAVKLHGTSGDCEGLTWQWGENKEYMADSAYIEKAVITQTYTPPLQGEDRTAFLIPLNVSSGGMIEIAFTIHDDTVDLFTVNLVDTLDLAYSMSADMVDTPVRLRFERSTETVTMVSYTGTSSTAHEEISPFIISIGEPHTLTIRRFRNYVKVLFDSVLLSMFIPTVSPGNVRLLSLQPADNASIHNVTFKAG